MTPPPAPLIKRSWIRHPERPIIIIIQVLTLCVFAAGAYALGSIDPSLYKINDEEDDYDVPDDHIGRIWFAVEYERESEKLLVTLIKAKNLPSRTPGTNNGCDPFVRWVHGCMR